MQTDEVKFVLDSRAKLLCILSFVCNAKNARHVVAKATCSLPLLTVNGYNF